VKGAEILTTIAQLAVAVTGFSGIAIAFNSIFQFGRILFVQLSK
jgi:Mn2+/Fe2+ NRAMP family transporter